MKDLILLRSLSKVSGNLDLILTGLRLVRSSLIDMGVPCVEDMLCTVSRYL
jgi:hypothetical protein